MLTRVHSSDQGYGSSPGFKPWVFQTFRGDVTPSTSLRIRIEQGIFKRDNLFEMVDQNPARKHPKVSKKSLDRNTQTFLPNIFCLNILSFAELWSVVSILELNKVSNGKNGKANKMVGWGKMRGETLRMRDLKMTRVAAGFDDITPKKQSFYTLAQRSNSCYYAQFLAFFPPKNIGIFPMTSERDENRSRSRSQFPRMKMDFGDLKVRERFFSLHQFVRWKDAFNRH